LKWFVKTQQRDQQEQRQSDKRRKITIDDHHTSPVAGTLADFSINNAALQSLISDDTIIANYPECSDRQAASLDDGITTS